MRSMTGMGMGSARADGIAVRVEVRTVNHRFLDVAFRMAPGVSSLEAPLREQVAKAIERGRATVTVDLEQKAGSLELLVNEGFVEAYVRSARKLARRFHLAGEVDLAQVTARPEALSVREKRVPERVLVRLAGSALAQALSRCNAMRQREGRALGRELRRRVKAVRVALRSVEREAATVPLEVKRRLEARLAGIGAADAVDPARLAAEVALLADRSNINEECERLKSHLQQFEETLREGGPVAKRLGFLLQEMHREVNTMGSKTSLLPITRAVIQMKEEIESMREQIQNLE